MPDDYPAGEFLLPLFPLPNVVFFPQTRLPLHVFEPRYRMLVSDALKSEERLGVILLRPGWENDYYGSPDVYEYGTLGRIEHSIQLSDGRFNILLAGTVRFRVVEFATQTPYRVARVIAEPETKGSPVEAWAQREWLAELSLRYLEYMPGDAKVPEIASATLDALTNALIMSLDIDVDEKQTLLELDDLLERANRVGATLEQRLNTIKLLEPFRRGSDPTSN